MRLRPIVAAIVMGLASQAVGPLGAAAPATASSPTSQAATMPATEDAVRGIVRAFDKYPVVIIGEDHMLRKAGELYIALARDEEFQKKCNDIVVEFASGQNQQLMDDYIGGKEIPIEQVRHIWRDVSKVAAWESAIYQQWLAAIRDVNAKLPANARLRVLAGDTPVDWSAIKTKEDYVALGHNNPSFVRVIKEQVLDKKRKCLLVIGNGHVPRNGDRRLPDKSSVVTELEKAQPGCTYLFVMLTAFGPKDPKQGQEIEQRLADAKVPCVWPIKGSGMESLQGWGGSLNEVADAVLYLGPRNTLRKVHAPKGTVDEEYKRESERRAMIASGTTKYVADLLRED